MASTTLSDRLSAGSPRRWRLTMIVSAAAVVTGLALAVFVTVALVLGPTGARDVKAPALGQMDDYYFRHVPGTAVGLGPMDDYYFRHAAGILPGPLDDYGLRHPGGS